MGADDRHSKPTSAIEAAELARLRAAGEAKAHVPASRPERPTSKLDKDELAGLLHMADAVVATKLPHTTRVADDDAIDLETRDRKTQRMRAKHFQMLVRDGVTDTLPLSPDGLADGVSDRDLHPEQRSLRVAGLPRAQTVEYSDELRDQLTAEASLEIPTEAAAPESEEASDRRALDADLHRALTDAPMVLPPKRRPAPRFEPTDDDALAAAVVRSSGTGLLVGIAVTIVALVIAFAIHALAR